MGHKHSKRLSKDEVYRVQHSTKFTESEIQQWYKKFKNDYPNGTICESEFVEMYSKMFPKGDARRFAKHVFNAYDVDGNGEIDFQEFMNTVSISSRGNADEKLKWAFKMYDLNGNGKVSQKEIVQMLLAIYRLRGDFRTKKAEDAAKQIFSCLDKDKDHELSEEEFITGAKSSDVLMQVLQGP